MLFFEWSGFNDLIRKILPKPPDVEWEKKMVRFVKCFAVMVHRERWSLRYD